MMILGNMGDMVHLKQVSSEEGKAKLGIRIRGFWSDPVSKKSGSGYINDDTEEYARHSAYQTSIL